MKIRCVKRCCACWRCISNVWVPSSDVISRTFGVDPSNADPSNATVHHLQSFTHRNAHMKIPPSPSYMELHPKTGHWQILQLSKWLPLKFCRTRRSCHGIPRASLQNVVSHISRYNPSLWDITLPHCWRLEWKKISTSTAVSTQIFEAKFTSEKHDQKKVLCS